MMHNTAKLREALLETINSQPEQWFDVSYRLRALSDGSLEFDSLSVVPITQSKDGK